MVKQILSVFDYFVGLALQGLISTLFSILKKTRMNWSNWHYCHEVGLTRWSVRIWSFSGPCFLTFGLNTEIYRMQEAFSYEFSPNTRKYGPEKLQIRILFA